MSARNGNRKAKLLGLEILPELLPAIEDAVAQGEDGITIKEAAALLGMAYQPIYGAVCELAGIGKIVLASRADRTVIRIALPGWEPPAILDLTAKQRATLEYLAARADGNGFVRCSMREICKGAPLSKGGIVAHLEALDRKGYLAFIERGRGTRSTLFKVWPGGDGPRSYTPPLSAWRGAPA